jgi:hypothetical protein
MIFEEISELLVNSKAILANQKVILEKQDAILEAIKAIPVNDDSAMAKQVEAIWRSLGLNVTGIAAEHAPPVNKPVVPSTG